MSDMLKNFDLNSTEVKQQFGMFLHSPVSVGEGFDKLFCIVTETTAHWEQVLLKLLAVYQIDCDVVRLK